MMQVSLYSTPSSCSGDEDSVIPLIGTAQTVNKVAKDLRLIPTSPYRVWFQGQQVKQSGIVMSAKFLGRHQAQYCKVVGHMGRNLWYISWKPRRYI